MNPATSKVALGRFLLLATIAAAQFSTSPCSSSKMPRLKPNTITLAACVAITALIAGCGTTRSSNTKRTATEQLLISDAVDRAVEGLQVEPLRGQTIFFDDQHLSGIVDREYVISSIRQHLLASGCILKEFRNEADYVVEARAGAIGTDHHDLLFGIPSTNVPQFIPLQGIPSTIPEVPFAKRRRQRGVAKIAVFAYHRETGTPVWQSGVVTSESTSNDFWVLGAGPFQRGTIHDGVQFAGKSIPTLNASDQTENKNRSVRITAEAVFNTPKDLLAIQTATENKKTPNEPPQRLPIVAIAESAPAQTVLEPGEILPVQNTEPQNGITASIYEQEIFNSPNPNLPPMLSPAQPVERDQPISHTGP